MTIPTTEDRTISLNQSLSNGPSGVALLHIERALAGHTSWSEAHSHVREAAAGSIDGGDHTGLYYGAPAMAFVLHTANEDGRSRYLQALAVLDKHVTRVTRRRLAVAERRIEANEHTLFHEYDLFYGLVGLGTLLLARRPNSETFADVLSHLVRLSRPRLHDGVELPGWWVAHDPDPLLPTPGGHANLGMAHGAAGILALLALAADRGHVVDGQREAIEQLLTWFDTWRQESSDGPWWPQWITRPALRARRPDQAAPGRPSWCYGGIGIARALQLAAIAVDDSARQHSAEQALLASLAKSNLARINDPGLCHGMAGIYQTVHRAACDSTDPALRRRLPALAEDLGRLACATVHRDDGLLTGRAGVELALETARQTAPPRSGWA